MAWMVSRSAIMLGSAFVAALALTAGARAAQTGASEPGTAGFVRVAAVVGSVNLTARMVETADLPAGFRPYAPLTGPLDATRAKLLGSDVGPVVAALHGWVRDWISGRTGQEVREAAFDTGTSGHARAAMAGFDSSVLARGLTRQRITAHLDGFRSTFLVNNINYIGITVPLARGPFFFVISVLSPAYRSSSAIALAANLVAAQSRKVPANTPPTRTPLSGLMLDAYKAAGSVVGVLLGYLGTVNAVGYVQNPLRQGHRRRRSQGASRWPDGQQALDVSTSARKYRRAARLRLSAQLFGLSVAVSGADPFLVTDWYAFVLAGSAIVWAGGHLHPAGLGLARNRSVLAGSRRVRVALMMSMASVMVLIGVLLIVFFALNQAAPAVGAAASAVSGLPLPSRAVADGVGAYGLLLVAAGADASRRARRLASVEARRLMLRDTRPPVLYLRSFGDDALKLWTATLGRPSLIERFTPRRFDAFEEVMVRHLSLRGPVIAVNPPGTKLAPLGAARETLDPAGWQSTIAGWMKRSALIVFVAPPARPSPGLAWEFETVSANRYWDKTLILVPPVPAGVLRGRWQAFLHACMSLWPFTVPLSVEGPGPLALIFTNGAWTVITADRQDEWAYGAALGKAFGDLGQRPAEIGAVM